MSYQNELTKQQERNFKRRCRFTACGEPCDVFTGPSSPDNAVITYRPEPERYEIRQIDAWHDGEGWTYNESWHLGEFATASNDTPRAFRRALARLGITFHKGRTVTEYDGDVYEIVDRATREPLFAAIPQA